MEIYMFLVNKLPTASQIASLWSFGNWAMPNTETFSRLWLPLSLQRVIKMLLSLLCHTSVSFQWRLQAIGAPQGHSKCFTTEVENPGMALPIPYSASPFSPKCGIRRGWTPTPWEHSWEEEKLLGILFLHVTSSDELCNWFTSLLSTPEQIRGRYNSQFVVTKGCDS